MSNAMSSGPNPVLMMCDHCRRKPKYNDSTTVYPYCGMACANLAKSLTGPATPAAPRRGGRFSINRAAPSGPACQIPGCSSPAYVDQNGAAGKYCTKTHRWLGRHGCISCRMAPANGSVVFCQSCYNRVLRAAPMIVKVPTDHDRYESVESQFRKKWLHSSACPEVRAIYKVVSTAANAAKFQQYLDQVEARHDFVSQNRRRGNENRRWHGTKRVCNIGDEGVTRPCTDAACSLCGILRTSFDLWYSARNTSFKRFGVGIYTSSTSSKTNDYSKNGRTSKWKAMLLNNVVVGCGYKITANNSRLTGPPPGFDSVIGEVGNSLNYDELVVYNNDAILPSYLVMYDHPQ